MAADFDAVIIGAGHNSLACAAHLALKGWSVAIFEMASRPGGAIKTLELTAPGFRHDWAAMNLSLFAGSAFHKANQAELARHGLEFVPVSNCFASVFPDGKWLGVGTDLPQTTARIAEFSGPDAETWQGLVDEFPDRAEYLFALLAMPMKKHAIAFFFLKMLRKKGISWTAEFIRFLLSSPRAWLTETFRSQHVRATLAAWGMHLDFAPDIAGGALFPYLEAMTNQSFGMVLGKGGADTAITALTGMIEARGGKIICDQKVAAIRYQAKRAVGVELADGTAVTAKRAVIANTAPSALLDLLPGNTCGDVGFDVAMQKFAHAPGTMMIHLAMEDLPAWTAGNQLREFAYVHLAPSLDQMALTYAQAKAGILPDEPVIVVGQPTSVDPSRAPEGKHVLWLQVRMVPAEINGDATKKISARDWKEAAPAYADHVLDIVESYAPGTLANIIARHVVSPLDLQADNPNLVGGDQICGSHHLAQNFLFRPVPGYAQWKTPTPSLYLVGAATWPGAGVGAGSGYLLGRELAGA